MALASGLDAAIFARAKSRGATSSAGTPSCAGAHPQDLRRRSCLQRRRSAANPIHHVAIRGRGMFAPAAPPDPSPRTPALCRRASSKTSRVSTASTCRREAEGRTGHGRIGPRARIVAGWTLAVCLSLQQCFVIDVTHRAGARGESKDREDADGAAHPRCRPRHPCRWRASSKTLWGGGRRRSHGALRLQRYEAEREPIAPGRRRRRSRPTGPRQIQEAKVAAKAQVEVKAAEAESMARSLPRGASGHVFRRTRAGEEVCRDGSTWATSRCCTWRRRRSSRRCCCCTPSSRPSSPASSASSSSWWTRRWRRARCPSRPSGRAPATGAAACCAWGRARWGAEASPASGRDAPPALMPGVTPGSP